MTVGGEIANAHERVNEIIMMGKSLGFTSLEWCVLLYLASKQLADANGVEFDKLTVESFGVVCECPVCQKNKRGYN